MTIYIYVCIHDEWKWKKKELNYTDVKWKKRKTSDYCKIKKTDAWLFLWKWEK